MLRVLVVEDDQDTATTCAVLLRWYGHNVAIAADGPSALQAVQANPPDVVLLDLAMPKMDGWHVAQEIRQLGIAKGPLLVAISGYGTQADQRHSQDVGIDLHLIKPVDPLKLEDLLKQYRRIIGDTWNEFKTRVEAVRRQGQILREGTRTAVAKCCQIRETMLKPYRARWWEEI